MALTLICNVGVFASEINYALLNEWVKQPTEVQFNLASNGTTIDVGDYDLQSYMSETWAVTNTYVYPGTKYVLSTQILLMNGHEDCLTHEVGHAISHYQRTAFFWVENQFWIDIYNKEAKNQMIYPQGWDNPYEYFACSYNEYLIFPKYMKQLQPQTYNYMRVVFSYLQGDLMEDFIIGIASGFVAGYVVGAILGYIQKEKEQEKKKDGLE